MSILKIEEAKREGAKIVLGLAGVSGGGKTYTAIQVAYGLARRVAKKVGFLDTENRRGRLYADTLPNGERFQIADFAPPFSPSRFIEAIREFEESGVEVLVIDSATHEWEGTGGCEEIATDGDPRLPRWNRAKAEHKKFMNVLLQSSMHIIVCLRAREKVNMKDTKNIVSLGIQPIQEKNFMFEMTASLMMESMGKKQVVLKCPDALKTVLGRGEGYLGIREGEQLRDWIDGAEPVDKVVARARAVLANTCEQGIAALQKAWVELDPTIKKLIDPTGCPKELKASAEAYDKQRAIANEDATKVAEINASLAPKPTPDKKTDEPVF